MGVKMDVDGIGKQEQFTAAYLGVFAQPAHARVAVCCIGVHVDLGARGRGRGGYGACVGERAPKPGHTRQKPTLQDSAIDGDLAYGPCDFA